MPSLNDTDADIYFRKRIIYGGILCAYAAALKTVRASGVTNTDLFQFGM